MFDASSAAAAVLHVDAALGEEVEHLVLEAAERGFGEIRRLGRRQGGDLGDEVREGLVGDGVDPHPGELLLELGVPMVFDVVVGPAGELGGDDSPSVWWRKKKYK